MSSERFERRKNESSDDGEISEESDSGKRGRSTKSSLTDHYSGSSDGDHGTARDRKEEEDRLRKTLLAKHKAHAHGDDEEHEMFTVQPGDSGSSRLSGRVEKIDKDKESKMKLDRERDRDRESRDKDRERHHKHKHDKRERDRGSDRMRTKPERRPGDSARDHRDRHRDRDMFFKGRRDRDDKTKVDKDKHKRHKRSPDTSLTPESDRKRERKTTDTEEKEKKTKVEPPPVKIIRTEIIAEAEVVHVVSPEMDEDEKTPTAVDADTDVEDKEEEITNFVLESPAGPQPPKKTGYSKYDSPEPDEIPLHSPVNSDEESDHPEPESDENPELDFDVETAQFEELTDEQIAMLSPDTKSRLENDWQKRLIAQLPAFFPGIMGCRSVNEYDCVNKVEEGTYGVVFRAKDRRTDEVVALKKLKMEKEREGFPITSLREVNMLLKAGNHENIVNIREIVIGSSMDKIYIVMEFVEHDLKTLMDTMKQRGKKFTPGEQKTLMIQLLEGLKHMHHLWILHRDLKSSNLLLSHKGVLKIADFGLAREFGSPLKPYTSIVVTLWYRAPELLLGQKLYSTPIDMWSVGCLMAEFHLLKPLFPGRGEIDQLKKIYLELGTPNETIWPGYESLPLAKEAKFDQVYQYNQLRKKFPAALLNESGFKLLNELLRYDPERRITAEEALQHVWFKEDPKPTPRELFPTFPAKSEQNKAPPAAKRKEKPLDPDLPPETAQLYRELKVRPELYNKSQGFNLRFDKAKF